MPGTYTAKFTADGKSYTQPLTIKMDPRVKTSADDLEVQLNLEMKIVDAMKRDYDALMQIRGLRAKLKELRPSVDTKTQAGIDNLEQNITVVEGTTAEYGSTYLSSPAGRSLGHLNAALRVCWRPLIQPTPRPPRKPLQPLPRSTAPWANKSSAGKRFGARIFPHLTSN